MSFHLARHTFATAVTLKNGVPIESVSKMLGHKKISTTQIYADVDEEKLRDDMARIEKRFLVKNSN
jgi:site-specific recombinase XerD